MVMLGLKETIDKLAKADGVCWYGQVLRREENDNLRKVFVSRWKAREGWPRKTWKN